MKTLSGVAVEWFIVILATVALIGFFGMPAQEYIADPLVMRDEAISLLNTGSLEIPSSVIFPDETKGKYFFYNETTHRWYSKYGIMNSIMYLIPLQMEKWIEGSLPFASPDRTLYLNVYNLILSLASAVYLFFIAARYTRSGLVIAVFILSALYCTFWWNYLRAQNSEIYQTLFMLAFYYHLSAGLRPPESPAPDESKTDPWHLGLAGLFLGLLILVKVFYLIVLPIALAFLIYHFGQQFRRLPGEAGKRFRPLPALAFAIPIFLALGVLLLTNWHRFGSPWETGYGQWREHGKPVFGGNLLSGLFGYLLDVHDCVFLYFPILVFALPGFPVFLRKHPGPGRLVITLFLVFLLVQSQLVDWFGGWCYGPRYLLSVLPLVSLPFLMTLEILFQRIRQAWAPCCLAAISVVLLYSFHLQMNANALPFFTFFNLRDQFAALHRPEIDAYFDRRPISIINGDLLEYKNGKPWPPLERATALLPPEQSEGYRELVNSSIVSNYYFFPDGDIQTP